MLKKDGESIPFTRLQAIITTVCAVLGLMYVVLPAHDAAILKDADVKASIAALQAAQKNPIPVVQTSSVSDPKIMPILDHISKVLDKIDVWLTYAPGGIKDSQKRGK